MQKLKCNELNIINPKNDFFAIKNRSALKAKEPIIIPTINSKKVGSLNLNWLPRGL
jgi:hypothetical protein